MKTKLSLMAAVALLTCGLLTGCTTTQSTPLTPEQKSEQTLRRATRITEMAAYDAGILLLKGKNNTAENRAVLASITNQLTGFGAATNATVADVTAYIAQLPIPQLKTAEGQLIAGGVLMIVDEVFADKYLIDTSKIGPVIQSALKGFSRALQFTADQPLAEKPPKKAEAPRRPEAIGWQGRYGVAQWRFQVS